MTTQELLTIYNLAKSNNVTIWLDGGWGIDALLEKQTREHEDVDIVVEKKDVAKLRKLLSEQGYRDVPRDDTREENFVLGNEPGQLIDFHVVVFDKQGNGIYGPPEKKQKYPASAFGVTGKISGQAVNCLTAEYQVESHTGYQPRERDRLDMKELCQKYKLKYPYKK